MLGLIKATFAEILIEQISVEYSHCATYKLCRFMPICSIDSLVFHYRISYSRHFIPSFLHSFIPLIMAPARWLSFASPPFIGLSAVSFGSFRFAPFPKRMPLPSLARCGNVLMFLPINMSPLRGFEKTVKLNQSYLLIPSGRMSIRPYLTNRISCSRYLLTFFIIFEL